MDDKKIKSWNDLKVLKKAHELVIKIYEVTKKYPKEEKYRLIDQICRASSSVQQILPKGKVESLKKNLYIFLQFPEVQ